MDVVPGCFPMNTPSVMAVAPSDFEHIYHQPSTFVTPDGPVTPPVVLPTQAAVLGKSSSTAKTAVKQQQPPKQEQKQATSAAGLKGSGGTRGKKEKKPMPPAAVAGPSRPAAAPVAAAPATQQQQQMQMTVTVTGKAIKFDRESYLKGVMGGAGIAFTDPWTKEKLLLQRQPPSQPAP